MLIVISITEFQPVCHTNINNTCLELHDYFNIFIQKHIPQRTKHRQQLPPWITPSTLNLMKKLKAQRELLNKKLTNYRKVMVTKLENLVTELCEHDRVAYQEELIATPDRNLPFKHVKRLSKSATIPKVMSYAGRCSSNDIEKANMLNQYFHSVF